MRSTWERSEPIVQLPRLEIERLVARAFPDRLLSEVEIVSGGLSNTNYRLSFVADASAVRLRIYNRGVSAGEMEAALRSRVPTGVPLPRCLHLDLQDQYPHAFLEWVEGESIENIFSSLTNPEQLALGENVGEMLATIHQRRFEHTGCFDNALRVSMPFDADGAGLMAFADACLRGPAGDRLGELRTELEAWLRSNAHVLDDFAAEPCLTHGDFGSSNILVDRYESAWRVAAILDWEYACSGIALFDLANLLRPPVGESAPFVKGVEVGYVRGGGKLRGDWRFALLVADLFARLEMLSRPTLDNSVCRSVCASVERTIRTRRREST